MSEPTTIYSLADVAAVLGVTRPAVSNWIKRYDNTPTPELMTTDGRVFWYTLIDWHAWFSRQQEQRTMAAQTELDRLKARIAALEASVKTRLDYNG